ncbi:MULTISPECIES: formate dehydrogenase accessory sulfurtransferase FdhD [Rhodopseudomonas]|uniref:formate dehydrogenase accessory sulfurtransferase FdhD n=1 Tax=Rhodopseudomonas TaxID=1073 RepID=UPI0005CA5E3D|nr:MULTISPECIES: formate dehydrogenase accessory sulfurtransferase FdhD [Rhodopseudomonas]MDF3809528.1 formate dehydrogenase accessory sulfurtransferase FdhD [Rhodopseudomonas sp. BAL398]WOK19730.1 formate dehydrogenase accessory sulfurtransferase FdhD [Rhodopseudomonas sp. BAL398]
MPSSSLHIWRETPAQPLGQPAGTVIVAEEVPVGVMYGGIPHAVMMATPADLEDFAVGFSVTEGIIQAATDIRGINTQETPDGVELNLMLTPERLHGFLSRRRTRNLRGHTSCGLCGVEEISDTRAETPRAPVGQPFTQAAVRRALAALPARQDLHRKTRAAHAAAWVATDGDILLLREDVGRHNALDKLIGAAMRQSVDLSAGFCLITSRCSYEMVQKALMAGMPAIVAISAPTGLAVRTAEAAGLTLVALARSEGQNVYAAAHRIQELKEDISCCD